MKLRVWNLTAKLYRFSSEMGRAVEIEKKKKRLLNASTWRVWTAHKCYVNPDMSQEEVYVRVSGNLSFLIDKPVPSREN